MTPLVVAVRSHLRLRWRTVLALAMIFGLVAGVALTAAAGARRTATAYPRLLRWSRASDVLVLPGCVGFGGFYQALGRLPQVASMWTGVVYEMALPPAAGPAPPQVDVVASPDGKLGFATDRVKVVAGRLFDPANPAAVMVDEQLAARDHLRPGSTLRLAGIPSSPKACRPRRGRAPAPRRGPAPLTFHVSAIVTFDDLVVPGPGMTGAPRVLLTPAFWRSGAGQPYGPGDYAGVRLRRGVSFAAFARAADRVARRHHITVSLIRRAGQVAATELAIRPEAVALLAFALLAFLIVLAVAAQLLSRQLSADAADLTSLHALGLSRARLAAVSLARLAAVTCPGAVLAVGVAIAASPLMPIGPARLAESAPGVEVNLAFLGAGLLLTATLPLALMIPVAWLAAGRAQGAARGWPVVPRRSLVAGWLTATGSLPAALGVRLAFEPGGGRTAMPVRSTIGAIAVAAAAMTAAVVFGSSLLGVISVPHRYGQNWSDELNLQLNAIPAAAVRAVMSHRRDVGGYAAGNYGQVEIAGSAVPAIGVDPLAGDRFLTFLAGHAPTGPGQIVLGERTMRSLRLRPGQRVAVTIGSRSRPMRIVGVAVFPLFSQATSAATDLGTGAAVAASVLSQPDPPLCANAPTCYNFVLIRFKPGASRRSAVAGLAAAVARAGCPRGICLITADQRPGEIRNVAGARDTPLVLGLVLAFLAVASLSHVLVTGARRRRRDLAVLKTLGLGGSQVMATVLWQSAAITAAALVIGLPAGLLAGRWTWSLFAGNLGVAARADVPAPQILAFIPAALLVACVLAVLPARSAARLKPAEVLRAE